VPFDEICFRVFYFFKYINILALGMDSPGQPALCQLYRHTFVIYFVWFFLVALSEASLTELRHSEQASEWSEVDHC